jgi:pectinesterase
VFSNCRITGETATVKTFLGRPWRSYASVAYLKTEMSDNVRPSGWDNWRDPARESTVRYSEFNSTGLGANPDARVKWARQLTAAEARAFTPQKVLGGQDSWIP